MNFLEELELTFKTPMPKGRQLKERTIINIISKLRILWDHFKIDDEGLECLKDIDKVHEFLKSRYKNPNSRKTAISNITTILSPFCRDKWVVGFEETGLKYRALLTKYSEDIEANAINQTASKKDSDNWTSSYNLKKVVAILKNKIRQKGYNSLTGKRFKPIPADKLTKHKDLIRDYMVGMLYTSGHNQRNIYGDMEVVSNKEYDMLSTKDQQKNYLVIFNKNRKEFRIGAGKERWKYVRCGDGTMSKKVWQGVNVLPINKQLNIALNLYLNYHKNYPYLLTNSVGKPLGSDALGKLIKKIFSSTGKDIGSSLIRKILYSEQFANDSTIVEKIDASKAMGNTPNVAQKYYLKPEQVKNLNLNTADKYTYVATKKKEITTTDLFN